MPLKDSSIDDNAQLDARTTGQNFLLGTERMKGVLPIDILSRAFCSLYWLHLYCFDPGKGLQIFQNLLRSSKCFFLELGEVDALTEATVREVTNLVLDHLGDHGYYQC